MRIEKEKFGVTKEGLEVTKYTMKNANGLKIALLDFGAVIREMWLPDREGKFEDVALGYDDVENYESNPPAFGAVIGRCANRIGGAKYILNGKEYTLEKNDVKNCLHGGTNRFEHHMYQAECSENMEGCSVTFTRLSEDMEQGFPGNATVVITYSLNDNDEFTIEYYMVSDADTLVNITNHNYFNLAVGGHKGNNVLKHEVQIFADEYTPIDEDMIPTGEIKSVTGTPYDFRQMHSVDKYINDAAQDGDKVVGYDNNFVLNKSEDDIRLAAICQCSDSGRRMKVYTDFPALQVYTSPTLYDNHGKEGMEYGNSSGICFETQNYPDAINHANFPSPVLRAGQEYERIAIFKFDIV